MIGLVRQKAPWLAQTKFHIPQIRDDSVARLRLSAWLAESVASMPITLVSAPAGYGKTTLLANSLERMPPGERALFIEQLARTHQETSDYLSDEVLRRQPEALQTFLLQTSILHTLTPQQCTAVTGIPHTAGILEDLYRRNVFILAVDSDAHDGVTSLITYRYHALFADFLRHRLIRELPDQAPELHRRAAAAQSSPARAIHHYAEAQMWDEAAAVIDAAGLEMIRQGRLDPLSGWISLLPEATRLAHPRLAYLMGLCELQKGEPEAAGRWLGEALDQARISGNSRIQGAALAALGSVNFVQLQFEQTLEFVNQALTYPVSPYVQVQALMARASVALFSGDWVGAAADLERALQIVESTDGQEALLALMLFLGQEFTLLPGALSRIEAFCMRIEEALGEQIRPVRLGLEDVRAFIHLRRGRLREAIAAGEWAISIKEQLGGYYPFLGLNAAITVATAQAALGEYAAAGRYLSLVASAVSALPLNQHTVANGLFPQARTYWLQGRHGDVKAVHAKMRALAEAAGATEAADATEAGDATEVDESLQAEVLRNVVASFIEISEGFYETAVDLLHQVETAAELAPLSSVYVCPQIIRAYALLLAQQADDALEVFGQVLVSCEEVGTPGIILQEGQTAVALLQLAVDAGVQADYAGRLLAQLQSEPTGGVGALREAPLQSKDFTLLTEREMEVLRLIAAGASNKAIAEELVISMPTVKSHVSHIFSKLNVSSRGQAGARAREIGLV